MSNGIPPALRSASYLRVALPLPLWQSFDYLLPVGAEQALPVEPLGCRIAVPFGKRQLIGVVTELVRAPAPEGLRPAARWLDQRSAFGDELYASLGWAAHYYAHPLGEVLAAALPVSLRAGSGEAPAQPGDYALTDPLGRSAGARAPRAGSLKAQVLDALRAGPLSAAELRQRLPGCGRVLSALVDQGQLLAVPPYRRAAAPALDGPPLNAAQQAAVDEVSAKFGCFAPFVLDGVTGSGKTEVYLTLIRQVLARGQQALVLVPEIGLTPQAIRRYRERLGLPIATLHSGLGDGERAAAWLAAAHGEAKVVLGTRSAILTPLPNAGLIVVDEEHDGSYKQQDGWRYSARDLALVRARALGVPVLLGSATPSLETLANVDFGRYQSLRLDRRAGAARSPAVALIDRRGIKVRDGLSAPLVEAIRSHVERGEQVLVFRNRRGWSPRLACHECGWHAQCPQCDIALTLHRAAASLKCHHCGYSQPLPAACPGCGAAELRPQGVGTERLEDALAARFPETPVLRIDRDSTRGKGRFEALLERLEQPGPAILVGTQMLAKGHDLPRLTLVAVVDADAGLKSADFRGPERLAQLLIQVAGRAGRGQLPGRVLVQTFAPEHPLFTQLLREGYAGFAAAALASRAEHRLPPFAAWAMLRAEAREPAALDAFMARAVAEVGAINVADVSLSGPWPARMARRAGYHRVQLLIESPRRAPLQQLLTGLIPSLAGSAPARRVRWSIDVDPLDVE